MSKFVGYKEGNMLQDIRKKNKDVQERYVISTMDVKMRVKKNKY